MCQIRFSLGLRPRRRWGAHSAPPGPYLDLRIPTSKGEEGRGTEKREGKGEVGEGERGGEGRRGSSHALGLGEPWQPCIFECTMPPPPDVILFANCRHRLNLS